MNPKISIVLPVYNGERYISESIESILEQTEADWELIIVDDFSTDSTLDIIQDYARKDNRIKIFRNDVNSKLPKSLNNGFRIAKGQYLTWTSDDNRYKANALETMVKYLESSQSDLVYCDMDIIDSEGCFIRHNEVEELKNIVLYNVIGACFMYRKELADKIGEYDETLFLIEDYDYWLRCFLTGKVGHINENLYEYRVHGDSLSATKLQKVYEMQKKVLEIYYDRLKVLPMDNEIKYELYDKAYRWGIEKKSRLNFTISNLGYILFRLNKFKTRVKNKIIKILKGT